ncbi:hypothetical protein D3C81_1543730 [compost metagenome]
MPGNIFESKSPLIRSKVVVASADNFVRSLSVASAEVFAPSIVVSESNNRPDMVLKCSLTRLRSLETLVKTELFVSLPSL